MSSAKQSTRVSARHEARVLATYKNQCSICRLTRTRLQEAAYVLSVSEGGEHVVTNGTAMCKIHHAAYDVDIFGIETGYKVSAVTTF
jgi:putative restriction endonuclease